MKYVIANSNPILDRSLRDSFSGSNYFFISSKEELLLDALEEINPEYIFFPHWSFIIPETIYLKFNCIVFHMTDLPFGRGGSPLQNLIVRGESSTKISALKVEKEIDAGLIYAKTDFCLHGTAEEIFMRAGVSIVEMIKHIIEVNPIPYEQEGEVTVFKRRTPEMSNIADLSEIKEIYDYIRMLDAEGYTKAYLETDNFRIEFSRASLKYNETILADVRISKK